MATAGIAIIYVAFCLLVGLCGAQRRIGFFGAFIISFLITPILMLLILIMTAPRRTPEPH
jgi:hypothetical protein